MNSKSFKQLNIYKRSYELSLLIHKVSSSFPKTEQFGLTDQLRRASRSICANIAEGYGRQLSSDNDFRRFLIIAQGSCHEMSVWIDYCHDLGYIPSDIWKQWQQEYDEISRMLAGFIRKLDTKKSVKERTYAQNALKAGNE